MVDKEIEPTISKLLDIKQKTNEVDFIDRIDILNVYIERELTHLEEVAKITEDKKENEWESLNELFLSWIRKIK